MDKTKVLKIIIIAGFCTVIFTPLSLAVMWFFTDWKKKTKIIVSSAAAIIYAATIAIVLFLLMNPRAEQNTGRYGAGSELSISEGGGGNGFLPSDSGKGSNKKNKDKKTKSESSSINSSAGESSNYLKRIIFPIIFLFIVIILVIFQNLRSKNKSSYENPYVDTKKYVLPLSSDFKFPMVHFSRLQLASEEKILYVTETNQADNEGDFVITNKRCVGLNKNESFEISLEELAGVNSISNSVIQLTTTEENKFFIFLPESQVKYAVAVIKFINS